ncbi:MAG: hypothetical protein AVDCRST_MAG27-726, partial [uncultured Craurococcus sp.]
WRRFASAPISRRARCPARRRRSGRPPPRPLRRPTRRC